jgi:hypothetical protein
VTCLPWVLVAMEVVTQAPWQTTSVTRRWLP